MTASPVERAVDALLELPALDALGADVESTLRRLQVLGQLNGEPVSVRRLAARTGISKSAAGRHVLALVYAGLAQRVAGGYIVGGAELPTERQRVTPRAPRVPVPAQEDRFPSRPAAEIPQCAFPDCEDVVAAADRGRRSAYCARPEHNRRTAYAARVRHAEPAALIRAAGCQCDRPVNAVDEDGDPICGRCGRAVVLEAAA